MTAFNSSKFILRDQVARLPVCLLLSLLLHLVFLLVRLQHSPPVVVSTGQVIGIVARSANSFKPIAVQPATDRLSTAEMKPAERQTAVPQRRAPVSQLVHHVDGEVATEKIFAKETDPAVNSPHRHAAVANKVKRTDTPLVKLGVESLSPLISSEQISWRAASTITPKTLLDAGQVKVDGVVKVADQKALPRYDLNPLPEYPEIARRRGYEGNVKFEVQVLVDGRVGDIEMISSSGHRSLDRAARKAVRLWRFQPATLLGAPVESRVLVPVRFVLGPQ